MTEHTPGPWKAAHLGDSIAILGTRAEDPEPDGRTVAEIFDTDTEATADARLIAAAPDLLAALEWIVEFASERPEWFNGPMPDSAENVWLEDARDAIAKAEGK